MTWKKCTLAAFVVTYLSVFQGAGVWANDQPTLLAGKPGTESHRLGVGLSSLIKVVVLPRQGIDLYLANGDESVDGNHLFVGSHDQLATFLTDEPDDAYRSVMAFRLQAPADEPPMELIAHADVSPDAVYHFAKAIFENGPFLNTVNEKIWDLSLDQALQGLQRPLHAGALRYYQENGGQEQELAVGSAEDTDALEIKHDGVALQAESTFFIYFGDDETGLDQQAQEQIAAACEHASVSNAAQMHVSGQADDGESDALGSLAERRVQSVMEAIGQQPDCVQDALILASNASVAVLPNELLAGDDDRVGITIMMSDGNP